MFGGSPKVFTSEDLPMEYNHRSKFINMGPNGMRHLNQDEEQKLSCKIRHRQKSNIEVEQMKHHKTKKERKYDPDLEITFHDFCRIMGFVLDEPS